MKKQKKRVILIDENLFMDFQYNTPATIENIKKFSSHKYLVIKAFFDFFLLDKNNINREEFYNKYEQFLNDKNCEFLLSHKLWDDFKRHINREYFFQFLMNNTFIENNQYEKSLLDYSKLYYVSFGKLSSPFSLLPEFLFHFEAESIEIFYNTDRFDDANNNHEESVSFQLFKNNKLNLDIFKYLNDVISTHKDLISYNFEKQINYKQSHLLKKMIESYSSNFLKESKDIPLFSVHYSICQEKKDVLTQYLPIIQITIPEYEFTYNIDLKKVCFHQEKTAHFNDNKNKPLFEHYKVFLRDEMDYIFKSGILKSIIEKKEIHNNLLYSLNKKILNKRL